MASALPTSSQGCLWNDAGELSSFVPTPGFLEGAAWGGSGRHPGWGPWEARTTGLASPGMQMLGVLPRPIRQKLWAWIHPLP